jgi:hypothetical protein
MLKPLIKAMRENCNIGCHNRFPLLGYYSTLRSLSQLHLAVS